MSIEELLAPYTNHEILEKLKSFTDMKDLEEYVESFDLQSETPISDTQKELLWAIMSLCGPSDKNLMQLQGIRFTELIFNEQSLVRIAKKANIIIPIKIRKKGIRAMVQKIIAKCHIPKVHKIVFREYADAMRVVHNELFNENYDFDTRYRIFLEGFENVGIQDDESKLLYFVYSIARGCELNDLADYIVERFDEDGWNMYFTCVCVLFINKMSPTLAGTSNKSRVTFDKIMHENKALNQRVNKQQKEQNKLKVELHQQSKKEKELKTQIHGLNKKIEEQLEDALKEISRLEQHLLEKEQVHQEELYLRENRIIELGRIIESNTYKETEYKPLSDVTVCVVGSPHKREEYKEVIEKYGGTFEFYSSVSETGLSDMVGPVKRSDIVLYLTIYTTHTISNKLKALKSGDKIKYLNANNIHYFENELLKQVIPLYDKTTNFGGNHENI